MKSIAVLGAVGMLAAAMPAGAEPGTSTFTLMVNAGPFDASRTYTSGPDQMLAEVTVALADAVVLDGSVQADRVKTVGGGKTSPVSAGTVMYAADDSKTVYCGMPTPGMGGFGMPRMPCLTDSDGDGRFDKGAKYGFAAGPATHLVMSEGKLMSADFMKPDVDLSEPVAYHHLDTSALIPVKGGIVWRSDYVKGLPGPVHFGFALMEDGGKQGGYDSGSLTSKFQTVTFDDAPVTTQLFGIKLTVVGMNADGSPICTLSGGIDHQGVPFVLENVLLDHKPH